RLGQRGDALADEGKESDFVLGDLGPIEALEIFVEQGSRGPLARRRRSPIVSSEQAPDTPRAHELPWLATSFGELHVATRKLSVERSLEELAPGFLKARGEQSSLFLAREIQVLDRLDG